MTIVAHLCLVDTRWVGERLHDPDLRIFDCTLPRLPGSSPPKVVALPGARIAGAGTLDVRAELSDPHSRWPLQYTMPTPRRFSEVMGRKGVGPESHVVLYGAGHPMAAARVWWMLHAMGFDNASVMDGGWEKWVAEDRPVSKQPCAYPPSRFEAHPRPQAMAGRAEVRAAIGDRSTLLLNALTREQHAGRGVHFGRAGRIPGSRCVPVDDLVTESGCFRQEHELRDIFERAGVHPGTRVITYCGVGVAASCLAFALLHAGHENVAVYGGSLAEWSNDPTLPIELD